jgi:pimeloyl-ACP methyl ester carboxylesterase
MRDAGGEKDLSGDLTLDIEGVQAEDNRDADGTFRIILRTSRGDISCVFTPCEGQPGVALMVGGASGGFDGPAGGLYRDLATRLAAKGLSTLRVNYRQPGEFEECVLDVLGALSFLKGIGGAAVVLVGHSFGGAVVIKAGELSPAVAAVAALSSQRYGTSAVENLAPRPLLLVHGTADTILPPEASEDIFQRAKQPKRLTLLDGAGHGLMEVRDDLLEMLEMFIVAMAGSTDPGRNPRNN